MHNLFCSSQESNTQSFSSKQHHFHLRQSNFLQRKKPRHLASSFLKGPPWRHLWIWGSHIPLGIVQAVAHQGEHLKAQLYPQAPDVGLHLLVKRLHLCIQRHLRDIPFLDVIPKNGLILPLNDQQAGAQLAQVFVEILKGLEQEVPAQGPNVHGGGQECFVQDVHRVQGLRGLQGSQQHWVVVEPELLPEKVNGAMQHPGYRRKETLASQDTKYL